MIVAEEMEEAVREKELKFVLKRLADLVRLNLRGFHGDDNLAQMFWIVECERKDVRGFVFPAVLFVERVNGLIVR